ncbi:Imidazole glycerol phosphate synthase subunit HisF [Quillaja saponaria]|uniref:Imidazole glycerol phosphate synthase subunit HisF n=1 Tax=Quillaja saponaria TaxID=32244 RepID=A0AAD7QJR5_QUISA|nr:Imidazole glycerol phosphate synthase subunit HisF [Quillaja saponaria]
MLSPISTYKSYPQAVRNSLFDNFMRRYRFSTKNDLSMARTIWKRTAQDRFTEMIHNARKTAKMKSGSQKPLRLERTRASKYLI